MFPYFRASDVRGLALAIRERFPGAELLFDAIPPIEAWLSGLNPLLRGRRARARWGMRADSVPEAWAAGIRLLESWTYFDEPEPRLRPYRWMAAIPGLGRSFRVVRYGLDGG